MSKFLGLAKPGNVRVRRNMGVRKENVKRNVKKEKNVSREDVEQQVKKYAKRNVKKEKDVSMENVERTTENQGEEIKIVTMGKNGGKENVEHPQVKQNGNGKKE